MQTHSDKSMSDGFCQFSDISSISISVPRDALTEVSSSPSDILTNVIGRQAQIALRPVRSEPRQTQVCFRRLTPPSIGVLKLGTPSALRQKGPMEARTQTFAIVIFALALGLVAHVLVGYEPFPYGDDFAYAPLAELRANPSLYPRDDQLRLFANHATVYNWLYTFGRNGPGVEPVFRAAVITLALTVCLLCWGLLLQLKTPPAMLPMVLGLGVAVQLDGLGRGDFGGLISPFFHHHNIALALVLAALGTALGKRAALAGLCLGLAAYAQPMTALHGAFVVGLATLLSRPRDLIALVSVSILVALPAAWMIADGALGPAPTNLTLNLIEDAYRFRAPHHYDPAWGEIAVTTLYLLAGLAGAALLDRERPTIARFAFGAMLAFLALHAVTVFIYKLGFLQITPLFILDANRSSPLLFVLGPIFALAGIWHRGRTLSSYATLLLLASIAVTNHTVEGMVLIALGCVLLSLSRTQLALPIGAVTAVAAAIILFPPPPAPRENSEETLALMSRIRAETPQDALFVVPIQFASFRHYAQRSVYVDFKMFSVAQPEQAALTRQRIEEISQPSESLRGLTGWPAAVSWDTAQHTRADCQTMRRILDRADADYFVRLRLPESPAPDCPGLPRAFENSLVAVYGPLSD